MARVSPAARFENKTHRQLSDDDESTQRTRARAMIWPTGSLSMFESTLEKFDKYVDKMEADNPPSFNLDLATEVRKRIEQLDYYYKKIDKKHERYMGLAWHEHREIESLRKQFPYRRIVREKSEDRLEMEKLIFEIETFTESFYHMAGRMRTILRHNSKPLPGLHSFECAGARNVRNHLLEHPEGKSSRVLVQSFGVGGEEGPTLKVEREIGQEDIFPDAGLWANAEEIRKNLEVVLDLILV